MKFALVTTHSIHGARFHLDGEREDATSFMSWVSVLSGYHFNFTRLMHENRAFLKDFDVVMFSGHPSHIEDIITMARELKDSGAVTVFYPEGSAQLYENSIRNFQPKVFEAWRACDILSIAEEDKQGYYEKFVTKETLVRFIHVPSTPAMSLGRFFIPRRDKVTNVVVYGDNNPNHPLIAMAAAREIDQAVVAVECGGAPQDMMATLPGLRIIHSMGKVSQNAMLRLLGRTALHFYPTEWFGTARQVISCAAAGTPCIGPQQSHTQMRLFPALAVKSHWDVDGMVAHAKELISNENFYNLISKRAFEESQFYNVENSKQRFHDAWRDAQKNKNVAVSTGGI